MYRLFIHFSHGLLSRLTALTLLCVTLPGCLVMSPDDKGGLIGSIARGEPQKTACFGLSASVNDYIITRLWGEEYGEYGSGKKYLSIPRRDLPKGCEIVRFFLNDSAHELQIAEKMCSGEWVAGIRPPLVDDSYPPCSLLVSYGSFSGPPVFEGMAVTSATGLVATSERQQPHPAVWALVPVGLVVDSLAIVAGVIIFFVVSPAMIISESIEKSRLKEEKSALPPPVAACWTAIGSGQSNWTPDKENAYVLTMADDVFNDDNPVPIDARVTLRHGGVQFTGGWTDADFECGLRAGAVVATRVMLRK